jgi:ABC-type microcin C transport system duplicated ATPase subunit YejF
MRLIRNCGGAEIMALLDIRNLSVSFATRNGAFKAVDGIDLAVESNDVLAIVGESGSGKSVAMLAVMGLLPWTASVTADRMEFNGLDLLTISDEARRKIVRRDIAMIFQEPMTSLNPCFTVGFQIGETLKTHFGLDKKAQKKRSIELLEQVVQVSSHNRHVGTAPRTVIRRSVFRCVIKEELPVLDRDGFAAQFQIQSTCRCQ